MMRRAILYSFIEQGLTSLGTLAMSAGLIATSNPETFGQFAFLLTLVLIAASLQFGLIGTSILVEIAPLDEQARGKSLATLLAFDTYYGLVASAVVASAALAVTHDALVTLAAGLFTLTYLRRETTRNALFALGRVRRATGLGVLSFVVLIALLAVLLTLLPSSAAAPLLASAVANAVALGALAGLPFAWPGWPGAAFRAYRARFPATGWILANSAANEVQTRAHVLAVQLFRGADQVGLLEAARVLFAPLFLMSGAWQRVMQPRLSVLVAAGDVAGARRLTLTGVAAVVGVTMVYCGLVFLAFDAISARLFGDRFGDVGLYAVAWAILAMLIVANWTLISFLKSLRAFRRIAATTTAAAAATAALLIVVAFGVPLIAALAVPIGVQAVLFAVLLAALWKFEPQSAAAGEGGP